MKHITRAARPTGRRSEYDRAEAICQPHGSRGMRWYHLVSLYEVQEGWVQEELCSDCVAGWVDVKLTRREGEVEF